MPPERSQTTSKAHKSQEQRKLASSRKQALVGDIAASRELLVDSVDKIAVDHDKNKKFVATQVHAGSAALIKKRKPSLYNAYLHHLSKQEDNGEGREKLPNLSNKMADTDWRANLTAADKAKLIHDLEEAKKEKETRKLMTRKSIAKDYNGTVSKLEPELQSLSHRTGSEYLFFSLRGSTLDGFSSHVYASPGASEACGQLFAHTPQNMGLKLEAFCVGGLAGALKGSDSLGMNRVAAQKKIRKAISDGLTDILLEKGVPPQLHPAMQYVAHERLVAKAGVELVGWPEPGGIRPVTKMNTAFELSRMLKALSDGECHWTILSIEEWEKRKEAYQKRIDDGLINTRKTRKDKGTTRKGNKKAISAETIEDSDEEDSDSGASAGEDGGEGEGA